MRFTCASSSSSCVTRWPRHRHTSGCNTFSSFSSLSVHSRCRRPHVYLAGWSHSQAEPQRRSTFRPRITLFVENGDTMNTLVGKDVIDHDLSSARCGTARGVLTERMQFKHNFVTECTNELPQGATDPGRATCTSGCNRSELGPATCLDGDVCG